MSRLRILSHPRAPQRKCVFLNRGNSSRKRSVFRRVLLVAITFMPFSVMARIHWDPAWSVTANGARYSVETFTSRLAVRQVVQEIAAKQGVYDHYLVADGRMFLSGIRDGAHWIAEVLGSPQGSTGYVSALYFDPASLSTATATATATASSLATGLAWRSRRFDFGERSGTVVLDWSDGAGKGASLNNSTIEPDASGNRSLTQFTVPTSGRSLAAVSILEP